MKVTVDIAVNTITDNLPINYILVIEVIGGGIRETLFGAYLATKSLKDCIDKSDKILFPKYICYKYNKELDMLEDIKVSMNSTESALALSRIGGLLVGNPE